jgi:hypothetical protein
MTTFCAKITSLLFRRFPCSLAHFNFATVHCIQVIGLFTNYGCKNASVFTQPSHSLVMQSTQSWHVHVVGINDNAEANNTQNIFDCLCLQMFFGMIRQPCGRDDHPTPNQLLYVYRLLSITNLVKPPKRASVQTEPAKY